MNKPALPFLVVAVLLLGVSSTLAEVTIVS
jgi:hypothetical protein